jgi:hypothetical protein
MTIDVHNKEFAHLNGLFHQSRQMDVGALISAEILLVLSHHFNSRVNHFGFMVNPVDIIRHLLLQFLSSLASFIKYEDTLVRAFLENISHVIDWE